MADFKLIPLPQDNKIADEGGNVSPAWLGAMTKVASLPKALNAFATETNETITQTRTELDASDAGLSARIGRLEQNLNQDPIANIDTSPVLNVGATYSQAEVAAIRDRMLATETKMNALLAALRAGEILSEE